MRMIKPTAALALLALAACTPPPTVPPPRFTPNPPYPPVIVDDTAPQDGMENPPPDPAPQPTRPGEYPVARPTANPNEVISPYPPYNIIDVEGFRSGQLARDPSNQQIFRIP
jgi:hypothetical protein